MVENKKIFEQIARTENGSNCNVLSYRHWIRLNELYMLMESFMQISN